MNLLEGSGDVIHVRSWSEKDALLEPYRLFAAQEVAVRAANLPVVQPGGNLRQIRAKGFIPEQRLVVQR